MKKTPILYPKGEQNFTDNGYGFLSDAIKCEVSEQVNNEFELTLEYPVSGYNFKNIKLNNIIYSHTNPYSNNRQPFRIYYISKPFNGVITAKAEHKSYELRYYPCMPNGDHVQTAGTCAGYMQYLTTEALRTSQTLSSTVYTFATDITDSKTWSIAAITDIKTAMGYAVKVFGGEWEYNGTVCTLKRRRGQDRGVKVQYNTNMLTVQQTQKDTSYSDILPYWTNGVDYIYIDDNNPILPLPNGTNLNKGIKPVNLSSRFAEAPTSADLLAAALLCDDYQNPPNPEMSLNVSFVPRGQTEEYVYLHDIDHVELGDDITTKHNDLDIDTKDRCNRLVYNPFTDIYTTATIGDIRQTLTSTLSRTETRTEPYVWVSTTAPTKGHKTGDYWIKINNDTYRQAQQLGRFTGSEWQLMCEFNNGGGVGKDLGNGNIAFNDENSHTVTAGSRNTLFGQSQTIGAGNCRDNLVNGYGNVLSGYINDALVSGNQIRLTNGGDYGGHFGLQNDITGGQGQLDCGYDNDISGSWGLTCGMYNSNTGDSAIAGGHYAFTGSSFLLALGWGGSSSEPKNIFTVDKSGNVTAYAYNTSSADFAEYFEWADGNPDAEDRMGLLVDQIGDRIAPAQGSEFFGAISGRPSVVGNAYDCYWHGKYLTDVYGRILTDEHGAAIISSEYDPRREYVPRSQRPEWAVVGLVGRVIIRDDGSCKVGGYVSARHGVGTSCYKKTGARVLRRIDSTHIEVKMQ